GGPTVEDRVEALPPTFGPDDDLVRDLKAELVQVADALTEARKLAGMPRGRFPGRFSDDFLTTALKCQDARAAAGLLRLEALRQAADGDWPGAEASARGALNAGRSIGDEPTLLSLLVRSACTTVAAALAERLVATDRDGRLPLDRLPELFLREADEPLFLIAVRGERAGGHQLIEASKSGRVSVTQLGSPVGSPPPNRGQRFLESLMVRQGHADLIDLMNRVVEAAKLPLHERRPKVEALGGTVPRLAVLVRLMFPAVNKVHGADLPPGALLRASGSPPAL